MSYSKIQVRAHNALKNELTVENRGKCELARVFLSSQVSRRMSCRQSRIFAKDYLAQYPGSDEVPIRDCSI